MIWSRLCDSVAYEQVSCYCTHMPQWKWRISLKMKKKTSYLEVTANFLLLCTGNIIIYGGVTKSIPGLTGAREVGGAREASQRHYASPAELPSTTGYSLHWHWDIFKVSWAYCAHYWLLTTVNNENDLFFTLPSNKTELSRSNNWFAWSRFTKKMFSHSGALILLFIFLVYVLSRGQWIIFKATELTNAIQKCP